MLFSWLMAPEPALHSPARLPRSPRSGMSHGPPAGACETAGACGAATPAGAETLACPAVDVVAAFAVVAKSSAFSSKGRSSAPARAKMILPAERLPRPCLSGRDLRLPSLVSAIGRLLYVSAVKRFTRGRSPPAAVAGGLESGLYRSSP